MTAKGQLCFLRIFSRSCFGPIWSPARKHACQQRVGSKGDLADETFLTREPGSGTRRLVTLDVEGLPVIRQWFVLSRKDKVLLPPAQAMLDFLSVKGAQFLPRTTGRLRLTRPSSRAKARVT